MEKKATYTQMTYYQRAKLKELLDEGLSKECIAEKLKVSRGTVFNELKRGSVDGIYDPEYADEKAWEKRMEGGNKTILEKDQCLARYISYLIKRKNLSPEQVVEHLKTGDHDYVKYPKTAKTIYTAIDKGLIPNVTRQDMKTVVATGIVTMKENSISLPECIRRCAGLRKHKRSFASARAEAIGKRMFKEEEICSLSTLYSYTERGLLKVKNIDLPEKVGRRVKKKKNRKHKRLHGQSIEKRPESINDKKEFGHWEIDLVIGKKEKTDQVLLTLTERKTKKEIIRKISGKTVNAVHRCLKKLKKETPNFNKIFRSITADNGVEFSKLYEIGEKMGIDIYYAHPYSSWERDQL